MNPLEPDPTDPGPAEPPAPPKGARKPRWIPAPIWRHLGHRPGLRKILDNIGWLFFDKFFRMGIGLIVGIWVARYLGPENYGILGYAQALIALLSPIAILGLANIVVRELVRRPDATNDLLGSAFILRLFGGFAAWTLANLLVGWFRPEDTLTRLVVLVLGFAHVLNATEVIKYWFEAQVRSKYVVWMTNALIPLAAGAKVILILQGASLMAFVWVFFATAVATAIGFFFLYQFKAGSLFQWRASRAGMGALLRDSWPLILSGVAIMVYMRIGAVMLGQMADDRAVGIYSAALKFSDIWNFVPATICASVFPAILRAKARDETLYRERLQRLLDLLVVVAFAVAIPMTFLADDLVVLLLGPQYADSGTVLAIHIWAGLFIFMGFGAGRWFLAENLQRLMFYRTFAGAIANVGLCWLLIPHYGGNGAAAAIVLSQAVASFLFNAVNPRTRPIFFMQLRALLLVSLFARAGRVLTGR